MVQLNMIMRIGDFYKEVVDVIEAHGPIEEWSEDEMDDVTAELTPALRILIRGYNRPSYGKEVGMDSSIRIVVDVYQTNIRLKGSVDKHKLETALMAIRKLAAELGLEYETDGITKIGAYEIKPKGG